MFAGVPVAEQVMAKVARHLAGLGLLPKQAAPQRPDAEIVKTRIAIAGGGAAGLAAAEELGARNIPYYLCERAQALGGRWSTGAVEFDSPAVSFAAPRTRPCGSRPLPSASTRMRRVPSS